MNKDNIKRLLSTIEGNANSIMYSGRAGSDEEYYVDKIIQDVKLINNLLEDESI